ncbi:hypothetical protein PV749_19905 [Streptomyces sp. ID03-2B]|uniref:Uncharacterized protein n=1 Tax=Streptomyces caviscabies TaxID=90079 RepID=A0ABW2MFP1_9ACTN|nr:MULTISPECIES: hypothetical protein [Streptomyces]MCX4709473.1 hypothetical protein [Streptomyces griseus]MDX3503474.1 hypothetical protein [Streptomyces sp. ATCC51928]MDX3593390.1 hypothetical protein [Streptomyces sp. ID03-2B]MDX5523833.1 hypothetical protein [Streptomyces sp. DE06-01C]
MAHSSVARARPLRNTISEDDIGAGGRILLYDRLRKRYLDWTLADPAGRGVEEVRPIRDEIRKLVENLIVENLIEEIAPAHPAHPERTA